MQRALVVGAGFAGLAAARALASDPHVHVTLVDRRNHHLFQALLYQVASAGLNASEIATPVRSIFRDLPNVRVLMAELSGLDLENREAHFDDNSLRLSYDVLVLALGGQTHFFGHPEWREHVYTLKSLEDALAIRRRVLLGFEKAEKETDPGYWTTVTVVGGGPTGVELSGAFAELRRHVLHREFRNLDPGRARIVLIESGPRLLSAFPAVLGERARQDLEALGVEVWLNQPVVEVKQNVVRTSQSTILTNTVVWAAGVCGTEVAARLGLPLGPQGRIPVSADLSVAGHPEIFCLGDMSYALDGTGQPYGCLAPVAIQQGQRGGCNALARLRGENTLPFAYEDPGLMATVGRRRGLAVYKGKLRTGAAGWLTWLYHHLLRIVDFENRVLVTIRWGWAYFAWRWGARLILESELDGERTGETVSCNPRVRSQDRLGTADSG